jgi:hypothetical protein
LIRVVSNDEYTLSIATFITCWEASTHNVYYVNINEQYFTIKILILSFIYYLPYQYSKKKRYLYINQAMTHIITPVYAIIGGKINFKLKVCGWFLSMANLLKFNVSICCCLMKGYTCISHTISCLIFLFIH